MIAEASMIAVGSWFINKLGDKGFDNLFDRFREVDEQDRFYSIVNETSRQISEKYPAALGGSVNHFFQKEEVFNELIKLLFIDSRIDYDIINSQFDIETLPRDFVAEFVDTLRVNLLKSDFFRPILTNKQIYITCLGVTNSVDSLVELTTLSKEELVGIRRLLEERFLSSFDINKFRKIYQSNAEHNLSQVNMMGLGVEMDIKKGNRKKISQIFVRPVFSITENNLAKVSSDIIGKIEKRKNKINYSELFLIAKNVVIIGNPGSGKSFLIKSIICSIINREYEEFSTRSVIEKIPFRIELRKYLAFKKNTGHNIVSYLSFLLESEYAISGVLNNSLEEIISNHETLFLFDGLDEIFHLLDKIDVKNDIENFIRTYERASTIITSRIEGYEEASFDPKSVVELVINKFNDQQIEEYVRKWYAAEEEDVSSREQEIRDFLIKKTDLDEELLRNPLLLSLIVILYRNNLKLPESKLEIYKSCASTLVDKWDSMKDLSVDLDREILKRKEIILADLAFWQYGELSAPKNKITYERAKNVVGKCLIDKLKLADEYTVEDHAEKFMTYASRRSIYFDNNFTHKTFLEYYTAYWIYTNIEKKHKKEERDRIIQQFIGNTYWQIVLELLINLIDKDQADSEIIDEIIIKQLTVPEKSISFLLTVLPSIQNVSLPVIEDIFLTSIQRLISYKDSRKRAYIYNEFAKLANYLESETYSEYLHRCLFKISAQLHEQDDKIYFFALVLEIYDEMYGRGDRDRVNSYIQTEDFLSLESKSEILYKLSFYLVWNERILEWKKELVEYIGHFGLAAALSPTKCFFTRRMYISIFSFCFMQIFDKKDFTHIESNLQFILSLGISLEDILVTYFENEGYASTEGMAEVEDVQVLLDRGVDEATEIILIGYLLSMKKQALYHRKHPNFEALTNPEVSALLKTKGNDWSVSEVIQSRYQFNIAIIERKRQHINAFFDWELDE